MQAVKKPFSGIKNLFFDCLLKKPTKFDSLKLLSTTFMLFIIVFYFFTA